MSAENPGNVKLKQKKFYQIRKLICGSIKEQMAYDMHTQMLANLLMFGDTQPAVVHSVDPLVISAYSDEFDAVIFLRFPDELTSIYGLKPGMKLVTACGYDPRGDKVADDIFPGAGFTGSYNDFIPVVQLFYGGKKQLFFTGGDEEIRERPSEFSDETWDRVLSLTADYAASGLSRDGFFYMK